MKTLEEVLRNPKKPKGAPDSNNEDVDSKEGKDAAKNKKPRYILFVGECSTNIR